MGYPPEDRLPVLEAVWEHIPVGIALYSVNSGMWIDANPSVLSMLGYSGDEMKRIRAEDILAPEDRVFFAQDRLLTLMESCPFRQEDLGELQFLHKDGHSVWVQLRAISSIAKEGSEVGVVFLMKDVTREKEARKHNQNNEALAQLMNNSKHDLISFTTPDGILTYISPSCRELLGYEQEEMVGKSRFEFYHPDEYRNVTPEQFYAGGDVKQRRLRHKKGNYLWFEISFQHMFDERGNMELMLGMGRNITDRKKVENILAEAQRIAHIGSWDWHIAEGKLYFSEEARRIFGYAVGREEDERLGNLFDIIHREDRERLRECLRETAATGISREITYRIFLTPQEMRVIHAHWDITWQSDGKPHRCVGYVQDITGKVEMERLLRESEQRYRSLFEYNPFCVFQMDLSGRMLAANPNGESLTGWTVSDIQDHSFLKIIHSREINRIKKQFIQVREGKACTTECAILHKNGSWIDLSLTLLPIIVDDRVAGVYGIANDITEQKRYVEQIEKLNDERMLLLNAVSEGIAGLDANGNMTFINPAGAKIFGFEPGEEKEALRHISLLNIQSPDGSVFPEGHTPIDRA
ncbi:MAG: sensor histidine kinase, partial [Paenibacillaceae bacterium]|nr:sensor histidine kinase [Paenibacillaceae bacterium]